MFCKIYVKEGLMKFIHLSDLHLGKKINGFSMLEDQEYILKKIIEIIDMEKPDCLFAAGDIYDKSVPQADAVSLFDNFLYELSKRKIHIFIISGNHDSAERLAFGSRIMDSTGIHISPVYNGEVKPVILQDNFGELAIYMLPFLKSVHIRGFFPDEIIDSFDTAVRVAISGMQLDLSRRNILISHQFVTGALRSDSEEISVGGSENVNAETYAGFDYVALGHIHRAQNVGCETIRYCGTPLKYSFSEINHEKSVSVVDMAEKGNVKIRTIPLIPMRDMRVLRGSYMELTDRNFYKEINTNDYFKITLTDEEDVPDAIGRLRVIYHNLMQIDYDNTRTRKGQIAEIIEHAEELSPLKLFEKFYKKQNNKSLSEAQISYISSIIEDIWEDNI